MNTIQSLTTAGLSYSSACSMLAAYRERIGYRVGIYEVTDIEYDPVTKIKHITLRCTGCGREVHKKIRQNGTKWSDLGKHCSCEKSKP